MADDFINSNQGKGLSLMLPDLNRSGSDFNILVSDGMVVGNLCEIDTITAQILAFYGFIWHDKNLRYVAAIYR
jgi:hypothetical protein